MPNSFFKFFKKAASDVAEQYGGERAGDIVENMIDRVANNEGQHGGGGGEMLGDLVEVFTGKQQGGLQNLLGMLDGNLGGLEKMASDKGLDPSLVSGLLGMLGGGGSGGGASGGASGGGGFDMKSLMQVASSLTQGGGANGFLGLLQGLAGGTGSSGTNGMMDVLTGLARSFFDMKKGSSKSMDKWGQAGVTRDDGNFMSWAMHMLMDLIFPGKKAKQIVDDGDDPAGKPAPDPNGIKGWYDGHPEIGKMQKDIFDDVLDITIGDDDDGKGGIRDDSPIIPEPKGIEQDCSMLDEASILFLNTNILLELRKEWRFLYSTKTFDRSFDLLVNKIVYQGPTLVVIKTVEGFLIGAFASTSWCNTPGSGWSGNGDSYVFSIKPRMSIFYSTGKDDHFLHLDSTSGMMGLGGRVGRFGLGLDSSLEKVTYHEEVDTFDLPGNLFGGATSFQVEHLEVWGLGPQPDPSQERDRTQVRRPNVDVRGGQVDMDDLLGQIS